MHYTTNHSCGHKMNRFLTQNVHCKTYLNNTVEVVTLSAKRAAHPLHLSIDDKKAIFIMAITHPV